MKNFKKLLVFLMLFIISQHSLSQLPYTWVTNTNPGWVSNNTVLSWRPACMVVTTNCTGNYLNNTNSTYTSPVIDATCTNGSTISITFTASGNAEYLYDFLFVEYSLNGGATWINPYGAGVGWTGNFGASTTIPPIVTPTSNNFRFRFNFVSDFTVTSSGYKLLDFDINCNVVLPINLIYFEGHKETNVNILSWKTESEVNNDKFIVERLVNETNNEWELVDVVYPNDDKNYQLIDINFNRDSYNYYRLTQVDLNGSVEIFDKIVVINNKIDNKVIKSYNYLGQEINDDSKGVVFNLMEDGSLERIIKF